MPNRRDTLNFGDWLEGKEQIANSSESLQCLSCTGPVIFVSQKSNQACARIYTKSFTGACGLDFCYHPPSRPAQRYFLRAYDQYTKS